MSKRTIRKRSDREVKTAPVQIDDAESSHAAFAKRLRILGKEGGSLSALARAAGVSDSTIHLWLRGSEPSREKLNALAKATNVNVGWLVSGEGSMRGHSGEYVPLTSVSWSWIEREGGLEVVGLEDVWSESDFAVKPDWIERLRGSPKSDCLILFRASGDAMKPTIEDGDQVLINFADREKRDGVIYAVEAFSLSERSELRTELRPLLIRRLVRQFDIEDGYQLLCDNPNFPPSAAKFQVFGRVIWYGRNL